MRSAIKNLSFAKNIRLAKSLVAAGVIVSLIMSSGFAQANWYDDTQEIMGTIVSINLWHDDETIARQAIKDVMAEMRRIDAALSPYKEDSELSHVNREAAKGPIKISAEMATIIDKSLYFSRISKGAFDISFASVGYRYDYRNKQQPNSEEKQRLLPAINYHLIIFNAQQSTLEFKHPDLKIDLGGVAKGYAIDRSIDILQHQGIESATISAGGDSRVLGTKRGKPWLVGIKNPRGFDSADKSTEGKIQEGFERVAITLPLENTAISTSGDYERFFIDEVSGERIHHIINPRTGDSATGIASVTVLGPHGFDTDPMSTTVFVMGVEAGLQMINGLPQFDCIIIDSAGKVHYSQGLIAPSN